MLKRITLSMQAYEALSGKIVSGRLKAGERLTEESLCAKFRISRTPLRDALTQLAQEGLIEPLPTRGYQVKSFTAESVKALFECRALLECEALKQGFGTLSRRKLANIQTKLQERIGDDPDRRHEQLNTDAALHNLIADHCPNPYIQEILRRLFRQCEAFRQYRTLSGGEPLPDLTRERLAIVSAILAGRRDEAVRQLHAHILRGAASGL